MSTKKDNFFNENNSIDNGNQYSNLNLNQNQKLSNIYSVQSECTGNSGDPSSNTESSNKLFKTVQSEQKDKVQWKIDKRSFTLDTDEWKIKKDVLDVDYNYFTKLEQFGPIKTHQNSKQLPTAFLSLIQNPFEFSRQQNEKYSSDPEVSQYKASQRLLKPNEASKSRVQTNVDVPAPAPAPSLNDLFMQKIYAGEYFKNQDKEKGNFDVTFKFGKKVLFANHTILSEASPTFNSWLSVRWTKNMTDPIVVDFFSFDDFFKFVNFIYSGNIDLNNDNVICMLNMSEYFGVSKLKERCDYYLSSSRTIFNAENVEEYFEIIAKYKLVKFEKYLRTYIHGYFRLIVSHDLLEKYSNDFFKFIASIKRNVFDETLEMDYFKMVYSRACKKAQRDAANEQHFNLMHLIAGEMSDILPTLNFEMFTAEFVLNFILKQDLSFLFPLNQLGQILIKCKRDQQEEQWFEACFHVAEIGAVVKYPIMKKEEAVAGIMKKYINMAQFEQMSYKFITEFIAKKDYIFDVDYLFQIICAAQRPSDASEENFCQLLLDIARRDAEKTQEIHYCMGDDHITIEADTREVMAPILPKINFYKMRPTFLNEVLVPAGVLTTEEALRAHNIRVEVTNGNCILSGVVRDIFGIYNKINDPTKKCNSIKRRGGNNIRFNGLTFPFPSTSTGVSKMVGCKYYLVIEESGTLAVKRDVATSCNDCILAELESQQEFFVDKNLCTVITAHRIPLF